MSLNANKCFGGKKLGVMHPQEVDQGIYISEGHTRTSPPTRVEGYGRNSVHWGENNEGRLPGRADNNNPGSCRTCIFAQPDDEREGAESGRVKEGGAMRDGCGVS